MSAVTGPRLDPRLAAVLPAAGPCPDTAAPPDALAGRDGIEVAVLAGLDRNGTIAGLPRLTYSAGVSTREDREGLFRATIEDIRRRPAPTTPALAGRIAEHQTFLRIIDEKPKQGA